MQQNQTLAQARHTANLLMKRLARVDADAFDRFDVYLDQFWNDQVSIEEAIDDMREILRGR